MQGWFNRLQWFSHGVKARHGEVPNGSERQKQVPLLLKSLEITIQYFKNIHPSTSTKNYPSLSIPCGLRNTCLIKFRDQKKYFCNSMLMHYWGRNQVYQQQHIWLVPDSISTSLCVKISALIHSFIQTQTLKIDF